jgi:hypothetical protein
MGLDGVELLMEYEDEFGIVIPDQEATHFETIGEVAAFVTASLLPTRLDSACPTAQTFRMVRRFLVEQAGVARNTVKLQAAVRALIPLFSRRALMRMLESKARWPLELNRHRAVTYPAILVHVGATAAMSFWLINNQMSMVAAAPLIMTAIALFAVMLFTWTSSLAVCFPSDCTTLRDLIEQTTPFARANIRIDPAVLHKILAITAAQMGVKPEELSASTRFADIGV